MVSPDLAAAFAAGMLLHLLLVVLVAARPSPRRLDRLFLLLFGALFLWHAGNYLALRFQSFSGLHRETLVVLSRAVAFTGLALLSPLLADVHAEYGQWRRRRYVWAFYLPLLSAPLGVRAAASAPDIPHGPWTTGFIVYFTAALAFSVAVNMALARRAAGHLRTLHAALAALFAALAAASVYVFLLARGAPGVEWFGYVLMVSSIIPSALVGFWMFRYNFLEARAQRTVAVAMLGLLGLLAYALVIQRAGAALERRGYLPSTVVEAILVFVLIILAEPAYRRASAWTARRVAAELARLDALRDELLRRASMAPPAEVRAFAAERLSAFFGFPVRADQGGALRPEPDRPLTLREQSALRVLAAHTAEALERSRLLAELAERQKLAALGEMTAFIAHRLKNPLSAIHTLVQVIEEQAPETAGHCGVIRGEIRRLSAAVSDLLRFTRPGEAPGAVPAGPVPAAQALEEAAGLFAADARQKGVTLETRADAGAQLPMGREPLHDILTSLLGNALEAAPPGSRVAVTCTQNGTHTVLAVEDGGPGVAAEHRERIFEPFFTLKPGGTGLGLALASRRAREAGGLIRCISPVRDNRGARFEVSFPRAGAKTS